MTNCIPFSQLPSCLNDWASALTNSDAPHYLLSVAGLTPITSPITADQYLVVWGAQLDLNFVQQLSQLVASAQLFPIAKVDNKIQIVLGLETDNDVTKENIKQLIDLFNADFALVETLPSLTRPGLVLMDMDSTAIQIECIDEIAKLAGIGDKVSEVTALAMQGKLDFEQSLRARVGLLKDADESIIATVAQNIPYMPGLEYLITQLKAHGWKVAIASGGFTYFANKLKADLGLDHIEANELEIINGKLTGQVQGRVVDAKVKAETLGNLAQQFGIAQEQTVAVGDGANDLTMMASATLGVALHAKPIVQEKAQVSLNNSDLEGVWYLLQADKVRNTRW